MIFERGVTRQAVAHCEVPSDAEPTRSPFVVALAETHRKPKAPEGGQVVGGGIFNAIQAFGNGRRHGVFRP